MTFSELWQDLLALIPVAGFAAAIVAAVVYVRYKGTTDALKETIDTYERLSEAQRQENEQLKAEIADLRKEVTKLELEMKGQAIAFEKLTERFMDSLKYGVCMYSESCPDYRSPAKSVKPE